MIRELSKLPPDARIIYSHDDEGNEYQTVNYLPSLVKIHEFTPGGRDLERCECENECNCHQVVIIN
jgi:hypothetical protein